MLLATILMFLSSLTGSIAAVVRTDLATLELNADHSSVSPGNHFQIVIQMTPKPGWHGYWENPGDAGLKLTMDWALPEGLEIEDLQFTTPHLIPFEDIVTYGYESTVTMIADASLSETYDGTDLDIGGNAFWLICSDSLCVPQEAEITFKLPIGQSMPNERMASVVQTAKADMPVPVDWQSSFFADEENFTLKAKVPADYPVIESAYLFPFNEGMMANSYRQDISFVDGEIIGRFKKAYSYSDNEEFRYVLTFKTGDGKNHAFLITAEKSASPVASPSEELKNEDSSPKQTLGLFSALAFAFLGGIILNLMPCVFPILSLKVMSIVALNNKEEQEARLSGLLYTAGVIVCFGLIGAVVSLLSVGWGFHMQMPVVNFALGLLMVLIGLNLLGYFEFGSQFSGLGQGLINTDRNSRRASFFTGFLAVVVATPCTAPFMASALGYAFIAGGISGFSIFIALGLGLSFPYLLLCYVPSLRKMLPRPGAWMETMKNILGFPMLATAVWLFWVLGNQVGVDAMAICIIASLLLALLLHSLQKEGFVWKAVMGLCLGLIVYSGFYISDHKVEQTTTVSEEDGLKAVSFSSDKLKSLIDEKKPVFVYFTADWCVTCKLNERVALSRSEVHQAFRQKNIQVMEADWTNQNPEITKTLQSYGRIGVPLYLYFPAGRTLDNPEILPQILTVDTIISAL
ncbi:MAG TPA: protein-disulfide reductase DsbD family protein [Emcibacteraceae bacterium]|nr:protein-disulfide reductase DsbD family protein [Emcibacteraceae bacterium]